MSEENDKNSEGQEVGDKEKTHPETADDSKNLHLNPQKPSEPPNSKQDRQLSDPVKETKREPAEVKEESKLEQVKTQKEAKPGRPEIKDHTKRDPVQVKEQTEPKKLEATEESPVNPSSETQYKEQSDLDTSETLEDLASQIITKEHKPRTLIISIIITIGLFVGPIFLIIDLLSPDTFFFLQGNSRMIFSFTTLLYFGGSIISAKNRVVELDE
ncbi:MAG: hypothetical protein IH840_03395 [Candidatus Heimdallarchaeota archaeon]|nr:hypothetical protein [Candidatus Heimdallarchaeota archaeon]